MTTKQESPVLKGQALKKAAASGVATVVLASGMLLAAAPQASADTGGYARIAMQRPYGWPEWYFEFGIPKWATSNTGQRSVAKAACASYLGYKLGLKWWMWAAPDQVCSWAVDRYWKPNEGMSVCGSIPLANVWGTRLWQC